MSADYSCLIFATVWIQFMARLIDMEGGHCIEPLTSRLSLNTTAAIKRNMAIFCRIDRVADQLTAMLRFKCNRGGWGF